MDRALAEVLLARDGRRRDAARAASVVRLALDAARAGEARAHRARRGRARAPVAGGGTQVAARHARASSTRSIAPLVERTGVACRRALQDAGIKPEELDGVILVGGSTRVPLVRAYVREAVRQGAARRHRSRPGGRARRGGAGRPARRAADRATTCSCSTCSRCRSGSRRWAAWSRRSCRATRRSPPARAQTFTTYADNQTGFELHVVQGERELAADCRSLARFTLKGIPPMPAGMARLEVTLPRRRRRPPQRDAREERRRASSRQVEVKPTYGLDDEQVEQMLLDALDHGEEDLVARRLAEARVEAERIRHATEQGARGRRRSARAGRSASAIAARARARSEAAARARTRARSRCASTTLDDATHEWAGRRMNRAIAQAIEGKQVGDVEATVAQRQGRRSASCGRASARLDG